MATDHATIGADLGKFARVYRVLRLIRGTGAGVTIDSFGQLRTEVEAVFDADDNHNKVLRAFLDWFGQADGAIDGLVRSLTEVMKAWGFQYLRGNIFSGATSLDGLIRDLAEDMRENSEAVLENVITTSAVAADGDNTGDFTVVVYDQDPKDGLDDDRIQTAHYVGQCITDHRQGGATAGEETFQFSSDHSAHGQVQVDVVMNEGQEKNRLDNGSLDDWTGAAPDSWTVTTDNGLSEETSTVYRTGGSALKCTADGSATAFDIEQAETAFIGYSAAPLVPGGVYLVSVYARRGASNDIDGTVTIQFSGTGYTPGSSEKITMTSLTTSYALKSAWVVMPDSIPSDFALQIIWNATPTSGRILYLDDVCVQKATEWPEAALRLAIVRGATDAIQNPDDSSQRTGDYVTFNTARQAEGTAIIQDLVTLVTNTRDPSGNWQPDIGIQLPHDTSASANYPEPT